MVTNLLLINYTLDQKEKKKIHFMETSEASIFCFGAKPEHLNPIHGSKENTFIPFPRLMVTAMARGRFSLRSLLHLMCRRASNLHHVSSQSDTRRIRAFFESGFSCPWGCSLALWFDSSLCLQESEVGSNQETRYQVLQMFSFIFLFLYIFPVCCLVQDDKFPRELLISIFGR